ncbi:hypothetical protein K438DRAFT_1861849 [Mycena galopus ATCC 62051]|nr:hypothetical protein K438DRAFT_1861849 [Mycena galopus ATCC 62051]
MASRPTRHPRPALTPGQSVVPLTQRADHAAFSSSSLAHSTSNPAPTMTSRHSPAPFPMLAQVSLRNPSNSVDHVLPSLAQSDAAFFNDILAKLKGLSSSFVPRSRTPPRPLSATRIVIDIDVHDDAIDPTPSQPVHVASATGYLGIQSPPNPAHPAVLYPNPTLLKSLVFVNLQNQNTEDPGSTFTQIVLLPPNPFASQLIMALNESGPRIAAIMGKWTLSRILVAYSKKLIEVATGGYNNGFSGYREVGFYNDVVGRFDEDGYGGPKDVTVPQILENTEARQFRELYGMPNSTHIFSVYIFHTSSQGISASPSTSSTQLLLAGPMLSSLMPQPPVPAAPALASSATSVPRPSAAISTHLEQTFLDAVPLCRALAASTLATYKRFAMVRHIRFMSDGLGMVWPETSSYPKSVTMTSGTGQSIEITIDHLLGIIDYPTSVATFKNHIRDFRLCFRAYDHLQKLQAQGQALTQKERETGEQFYILFEAEFLDPRVTDFIVPPAYASAVTESVASLITQANKILVVQS